ncbi:MAG: ERV1/ALR-related protein [Pseudomonadales bacterium]
MHVTGKNAPEVVRHLFAIYAQNGIDVDMTTLWYNANLSWLQRSLSFDRRCSYEDLLSLSQEPEEDDDLYTPLEWGGLAWKFAALYLSKSSFDEQRFQQILQALKDLVSDESIGCAECHDHFTDRLLRFPDLTTQQKAREWLWTTINEIRRENNKPTLTFEQASSLHHWR